MPNQKIDLQLRGLWTAPNSLSGVPEGALERAENVVLNSKFLIESRRGQTQYLDAFTLDSGAQINKLFNYSSSIIVSVNDELAFAASDASEWTYFSGSYTQPDPDFKMRSLEALKNFYFTTDSGIFKIDSLAIKDPNTPVTTPRAAGVVKALGGVGSLTGVNGFLLDDSAVAYRMVWGYKDANNNLLLGAPSQRLVVANSSSDDVDVTLTFVIPASITTEYFYQIYRSNGTAAATDEPSDELQLVLQGNPTAGEISAKSFTVEDITPYSLMRTTLYTSPSQQGIANANVPPPLSLDMDVFKTSAFYANTTQHQLLTVTLISVGSPSFGYLLDEGDTTNDSDVIDGLQSTASLVMQDLTYTAVEPGFDGNDISLQYTGGGSAGSEVVTVTGSAISIQIQDGVSDADQVKAAFDAVSAATDLATCVLSGPGNSKQNTQAQTYLSGGCDTSRMRVGMKVIGTGIPADTLIASIIDVDSITIDKDATATASGVALEFQDRFSLGGVDYFAGSSNNVTVNQFFADVTGTPGQNIGETASNLIQIINTSASNTTIYGYYISALDDLPGQMFFEERSLGGSSFVATSTAGTSFSPILPDKNSITAISIDDPTEITSATHGLTTGDLVNFFETNSTPVLSGSYYVTVIDPNTFSVPVEVTGAGTTGYWLLNEDLVQSDNEVRSNRVYISKPGEVESVPTYRYFDIGSANFPILRCIALRDGIFFLKTDGVFRISGETFESFIVTLVDNTIILQVQESAVAFNNQIFCYTSQGICAITDAGVRIISVPIENTLLELSSDQFPYFPSASFGVAYESARLYMFFTVTDEADTVATQAFIYNSLTDTWTRWVMNRTCGLVNTATDTLFMGESDTGQVVVERKNFTNDDYADLQYAVTINSVDSSTALTLASVTDIEIGMTIKQGVRATYIEEINGSVLTVTDTHGFETGAATVYEPILNLIKWAPIDVGNPGLLKQFSEISLFFKNAAFREILANFTSNIFLEDIDVTLTNNSLGGSWGGFRWGTVEWGGRLGGASVLRTYVPRSQQRAHWLNLSLSTEEAFTGFSLQGVSLIFNVMSSRFK